MSFGTLSIKDNAIPACSPPYSNNVNKFSNVNLIVISYRVTLASVQPLVPSVLELEPEPLVSTYLVDYGMSSVSSYKEFVQTVKATYRGEKFDYNLFLALDNEAAIFAGREVFGKTDVDFATGGRLVTGLARAPRRQDPRHRRVPPGGRRARRAPPAKRALGLRVVPSPVPGAPPSVNELVPPAMDFKYYGEVWLGKGHVSFPTTSARDPRCNLDILRPEGALLATGASAELRPPTETFPLD